MDSRTSTGLFRDAASERATACLQRSCLVRFRALFLNTFDFLLHQNAQFLPYGPENIPFLLECFLFVRALFEGMLGQMLTFVIDDELKQLHDGPQVFVDVLERIRAVTSGRKRHVRKTGPGKQKRIWHNGIFVGIVIENGENSFLENLPRRSVGLRC